MTVTRRITGHWLRGCHCCAAKQRGNNECCRILHSGLFISFCCCGVENKRGRIRRVTISSNPQSNPFTSLTTFSLPEVRLFDMIEVHASNQSKPYSVTL